MKHSLSFVGHASLSTMVLCSVALAAATASAQTQFNSGSTGADGPLTYTTPGEYTFDMTAKPDGVWNFTTINIPAGVKVSFKKNAASTGVVWLATGDVNIAGEVNLGWRRRRPERVARQRSARRPGRLSRWTRSAAH